MEDPCSKLVPLNSSKDSMYLDATLYAEVLDGIDKEQIDLLSENIVVDKLLEKLWDEESTLKSLAFPLMLCLLMDLVRKACILLW